MVNLTISQKQVIRAMLRLGRFATINEISHKANMSWNTVSSVIKRLSGRGAIQRKTLSGRTNYKLKRR